jgi:hypothetical protein
MKAIGALVIVVSVLAAACGSSSPMSPTSATPAQIFAMNGSGNTVFNVPTSVTRIHITGTYTGFTSNFIVWAGPSNINCDSTFNLNCHLLVNDLVGTAYGRTVSDGTYVSPGSATMQIVDSSGVSWSFTEVR